MIPQQERGAAVGGAGQDEVVQPKNEPTTVSLREARDDDVDALYAHQADPEAAAMADFPSRDREAFLAHLAGIRADPEVRYRVIEADGVIVGNIGSFDAHGGREVGYWIDRAHWGRGVASRALGLLLAQEPIRPLQAGVAPHNAASRRVLEKVGFVPDGIDESDGMLLFRLDA